MKRQKRNKHPCFNGDLLSQVENIVMKNISNADFTVEHLSQQLGISRMHLHRRIKKETGRNTSSYIRHIRLEYAKVLLKTTELNITEVAYEVGFAYPAYFTLCFVAAYGMTPKKYKES